MYIRYILDLEGVRFYVFYCFVVECYFFQLSDLSEDFLGLIDWLDWLH